MKPILTLCCTTLLATLVSCGDKTPTTTGIIPIPQEVVWQSGTFSLPETVLYTTDLPETAQADLAEWMERAPLVFAPAADEADASLRLTTDASIDPEGYRLRVDKKKVSIVAADPAGIFYGLQSLAQMAEHFDGKIPAVEINDAPRFPYRGLMLDVSRNFRDKEYVKKQLDLLARYKINQFHWHLVDGAGWRIEIEQYPELTDIAAWRPYADWDGWNYQGRRYCRKDDPGAVGGFYTQDEIREVIEYARKLHITVIPEIEMPGHSEEVLAVYPQLSCSGKPYTSSDFCVGNEETFTFLTNVLSEVIDLFPSEYIHIGGDEAGKGAWRTCSKCQTRMKREKLQNVDELQSYMIHRIEVFLNSKGRKLLGWDEILEGGLAPNATVMSWRGTEGGIKAAQAGHHAIMTPTTYCYLDFCQDDPTKEPPAAAAFVTLEKAYSYDPAPDSLGTAVTSMILGVQGNLWAERVATDEHSEHMIWPRMLAIAEVGWSDPSDKNYEDFYPRALEAIEWMQARGYHPFDQKNAVGARPESKEPYKCLSTGKPVTYNPKYSDKYSGAGDTSMTDGLRGDWNYGDGRWQGWVDTDVELTVDLESVQPVKHISAIFMQGFSADIWMPKQVIFSVSDDGKAFTTLGTVDNDVDVEYRKNCFKDFRWTGETKARYVRLKAFNNGRNGGWIFTDEVIVE